MDGPLLTAAMIVRDEEAHLPDCLRSIRNVVDEIVVIDTGSSDATVEIARSFGARVQVHPWQGDFAAARNAGLDLARGAWILYIDADERLRPVSRERVEGILEAAADHASLRVRLVPFTGATPFWEFRIWRSDPRIRFVGKMHEKVTPAIAEVARDDGLMIGESELCLDHVGYDGDQTQKHERNLPLLQTQLATEPLNAHNWTHLARVLDGLGRQDEAEAALARAIDAAHQIGLSVDVTAYLELIGRRREQSQPVADLIDTALTWYPDNLGLAWEKARSEMEAGKYEAALRWLERLDADPAMPVEDTVGYPTEIFGARSAEARGLCHFRLGRYGDAATAYREAEKLEPDVEPHRLKRILSEHRAESNGAAAAQRGSARWSARRLLPGLTVDVAGVPIGLSATDSVRAQAIREVLGRMPATEDEPLAHLRFAAHHFALPGRPPDETQLDVELWHDDDALCILCGKEITARVADGRAELGGFSRYLTVAFQHASPFVLASLLAPHGRFLLHGGAIQRDGQAVLVLGGSGKGKTTLTFGALRAGWGVLSDDLVAVRADGEAAVVTGLPKALL